MKTMKTMAIWLSLFTLGIASTGCVGVAKKETQINPGSASINAKFSVGEVTNATGLTFDFDIVEELKKQLLSQLQEQRLDWREPATGNHFVLNAEILDYCKGSAFGRWLGPGIGKTLLDVQCAILESGGGEPIGKVKAMRAVNGGGLFSAGQWKIIFRTVAKDVVRELKAKVNSQTANKKTP